MWLLFRKRKNIFDFLTASKRQNSSAMSKLPSMSALTNATIRHVVHEDISYKSFVMRRGHFMSDSTKVNCLTRTRRFLNKLKHPDQSGLL